MLEKKTLYAICLIYKVNNLCLDNSSSKKAKKTFSDSLIHLRLRSYLSSNGQFMRNLDDTSLLNLLMEMRTIMDTLSLPRKAKDEIPSTLHQFNKGFKKWLVNIQSNQHQ